MGKHANIIMYGTKHWATVGIEVLSIDHVSEERYYYDNSKGYSRQHVLGRDCFSTRDEAVADCEKKRAKKIKSLSRQIGELGKIDFKEPPHA